MGRLPSPVFDFLIFTFDLMNEPHPLILFDGFCNLCSAAVQFVIKRDPKYYFRFASLQSETGQRLLQQYQVSERYLDSFVLVEDGIAYTRSAAALRVTRKLSGFWPLTYGLIIIPPLIRNAVYNWIARKRYDWFGKKEECWLPDPSLKKRFIDQ
jgi:predicted DCC family thiol-disulfide oxidoreductase YuxK